MIYFHFLSTQKYNKNIQKKIFWALWVSWEKKHCVKMNVKYLFLFNMTHTIQLAIEWGELHRVTKLTSNVFNSRLASCLLNCLSINIKYIRTSARASALMETQFFIIILLQFLLIEKFSFIQLYSETHNKRKWNDIF